MANNGQSLVPDSQHGYEFPYRAEMPEGILTHPNNPYLESQIFKGTIGSLPGHEGDYEPALDLERIYLVPYRVAELVEPRLEFLTAGLWTTVTADNTLVRKLLQYYFLCEYPSFPFFSKDAFLDDLADGRSDHCSSLLVNSILALARYG